MTQTALIDRARSPLMLSVMGTAFIACGLSTVPSTAASVAIAVIVGLMPIAVLVLYGRWGRISEKQYLREAFWFVPAVGFYPVVAAINPDQATALVLGTASVYLLLASRVPWRGAAVGRLWFMGTIGGCAIAGTLADLPTPLGWNSLAYSCFGASAFAALTAATTPDPAESSAFGPTSV
jgi:hypothetical protein